MKLAKLLTMLVCLTLMSTGCRHDHHQHEEKSPKTERAKQEHHTEGEGENHRH